MVAGATFFSRTCRQHKRAKVVHHQHGDVVLSLKRPVLARWDVRLQNDAAGLARETWRATELIERSRAHNGVVPEDAGGRDPASAEDMLELSTPVVKLWDGHIALPMIGTLDSARDAGRHGSRCLQRIVENGRPDRPFLDITGVPTVDTLVATAPHQDRHRNPV
jgi:hypothetical protein